MSGHDQCVALQGQLSDLFPDSAASVPLSLVLHRVNDTSVLGRDLKNYTALIQDYISDYVANTAGAAGLVKPDGVVGYVCCVPCASCAW